MRLVFVCLSADPADPTHATTARWIDRLADRPEIDRLTVLALHARGIAARPDLRIMVFRGRNRIDTVGRFYQLAVQAVRDGSDAFFVYQGGPYPLLLWPLKLLYGTPIYYWKAHPYISLWTRLSARLAATKVFTSTPAALPVALPHLVVVGQGVDVDTFAPRSVALSADLVTVGRIAPVKRLDQMIRAVARCHGRFAERVRLDIYGPTLARDGAYARHLARLADDLGLSDLVTFRGPVRQDELPALLSAHRVFLNFSRTALDRSAVEAMACGVPVLSTNQAVAQILPAALHDMLIVPEEDLDAQADAIYRLLHLDDAARQALSASLRQLIVSRHNLDGLIDRLVSEMGRPA